MILTETEPEVPKVSGTQKWSCLLFYCTGEQNRQISAWILACMSYYNFLSLTQLECFHQQYCLAHEQGKGYSEANRMCVVKTYVTECFEANKRRIGYLSIYRNIVTFNIDITLD